MVFEDVVELWFEVGVGLGFDLMVGCVCGEGCFVCGNVCG